MINKAGPPLAVVRAGSARRGVRALAWRVRATLTEAGRQLSGETDGGGEKERREQKNRGKQMEGEVVMRQKNNMNTDERPEADREKRR